MRYLFMRTIDKQVKGGRIVVKRRCVWYGIVQFSKTNVHYSEWTQNCSIELRKYTE